MKDRHQILVQLDAGRFTAIAMKRDLADLAVHISFHVEPHIHVIALRYGFSEESPSDFDLRLHRQPRLHAAFRNAVIARKHDFYIFRQQGGIADLLVREMRIVKVFRDYVLRTRRRRFLAVVLGTRPGKILIVSAV